MGAGPSWPRSEAGGPASPAAAAPPPSPGLSSSQFGPGHKGRRPKGPRCPKTGTKDPVLCSAAKSELLPQGAGAFPGRGVALRTCPGPQVLWAHEGTNRWESGARSFFPGASLTHGALSIPRPLPDSRVQCFYVQLRQAVARRDKSDPLPREVSVCGGRVPKWALTVPPAGGPLNGHTAHHKRTSPPSTRMPRLGGGTGRWHLQVPEVRETKRGAAGLGGGAKPVRWGLRAGGSARVPRRTVETRRRPWRSAPGQGPAGALPGGRGLKS